LKLAARLNVVWEVIFLSNESPFHWRTDLLSLASAAAIRSYEKLAFNLREQKLSLVYTRLETNNKTNRISESERCSGFTRCQLSPARSKSFPMTSKGPSITKHRLTSRLSSVKVEYAPVYMSCNTYIHPHTEDGIPALDDVARTSTSFTTYMLHVSFYALRLYNI